MSSWSRVFGLGFCCLALSLAGCKKEPPTPSSVKKQITIGMVAKSQSNDVFQAAYAGAKDAASELGSKYGVDVTIDWRTPVSEDAAKQVEAIEALTRAGVSAIIVSCSDAATVSPAIDEAVDKGVPVMCFDSDAPASKRFCSYGTDDTSCGQRIMEAVCKSSNDQGVVAILAGNQSAPNLQKRVVGAKDELATHPGVKLLDAGGGVFYHEETPEKAAEAVATATNANPQITGWCFIGGWPLFTTDALKWPPGQIKVASCDALPAELVYVRDGHVQTLFAQDCYGWGHKSVEVVLAKVLENKSPESVRIVDPLTVVTKDNVDEFAKKWDVWLGKK